MDLTFYDVKPMASTRNCGNLAHSLCRKDLILLPLVTSQSLLTAILVKLSTMQNTSTCELPSVVSQGRTAELYR